MADHFKLDMTNRSTRITIFKNVSDNFAEEYRAMLSGNSDDSTGTIVELNLDNTTWAMKNAFSIAKKEKIQKPEVEPRKHKSPNTAISETGRKYAVYNYNKRLKRRAEQFRTDAYMNFRVPNVQFVTLTFDSRTFDGATDLDICHNALKKFIQRIHYDFKDFAYIATFSRQKKTNNWHYHMLCNFDMNVKNKYIQTKWSYGMTESTPLTSHAEFSSRISYCIDNMYQVAWDDLHGEKGYLNSKGLIKRMTFRSWKDDESEMAYKYLAEILNSTDKPLDLSSYDTTDDFNHNKVMITRKVSLKTFDDLFPEMKIATPKKKRI